MENKEFATLDMSEDEIRENFRLLTGRPISRRTILVGRCIAKSAQGQVIRLLKTGLKPLPDSGHYLIEAGVVDELLRRFNLPNLEVSSQE